MAGRFAIGVDLGGTNLRVAVVTAEGELLEKVTESTKALHGSDRVVDVMASEIRRLTAKHSGPGPLLGIGIGIPGILDLSAGILRKSPNLPGWEDYPVRQEIERRIGAPVVLDNDANAAAMGEFWLGAGRGHDSLFMLTQGTGVGGGIVLNGKIWHGMTGMAGEPGHLTVEPDGPPCGCGNRGCLEQYAGATAIMRMAREAAASGSAPGLVRAMRNDPAFGAQNLHVLALAGDKAALEIFRRAGKALGIALSGLINVLNVSVYCFGGGVAGAWDMLQPHILKEVRERSFVYNATAANRGLEGETIITCALLGPDAGLYGAARLAILKAAEEQQPPSTCRDRLA
ncbi:MAG TPA: ROK family protein [Terriglobales bacterium]|nr:ROK family protein [Terriglobales bacterium]